MERYADDAQGNVLYRKKEDAMGYVYLAKKTDDTEIIYYDKLESMLDYVDKTIKTEEDN